MPVWYNKIVDNKLTHKQELFCLKYVELGCNGTQAALATYDVKDETVANAIAVENLRKPLISERVSQLLKPVLDKAIAGPIERKKRLTEMVRANLIDFMPDGEVKLDKTSSNQGAVSEYETVTRYNRKGDPYVTKRIKLRDPIAAISELNKMEGVYDTKDSPTEIRVIITYATPQINSVTVEPLQIEEAMPASNTTHESTEDSNEQG